MKTRILTIVMIALMMGITVGAYAGNEDTTKLMTPSEQSAFQASVNLFPDNVVQFHIVKPEQDKVKLRVYSEGGTLIYSYSLRKCNCARIGFETSKLEPGKYDYVVERNKIEVLRKTIEKSNKSI